MDRLIQGSFVLRNRLRAAIDDGQLRARVAFAAGPVALGSGVLVDPDQTSVRAKALTHASAKWDWIKESFGPGTHLIRLSYGRNGVIEESLDELPEQARRDAERILGVKLPKVTDVKVTRWADSLVHQRVGHRQNVQALQEAVAAQDGLAIIGAGIGGNGIAGSIAYSRTLGDQLGVNA